MLKLKKELYLCFKTVYLTYIFIAKNKINKYKAEYIFKTKGNFKTLIKSLIKTISCINYKVLHIYWK